MTYGHEDASEDGTSSWRLALSRRALLRTSALGGIGIAAAALIGCDDDDDDDDDDATSSPTPGGDGESPTPTATGDGDAGGGDALSIPKPNTPEDVDYARNVGKPNAEPQYGGVFQTTQRVTFPTIDPTQNAAGDPAFYHGLHSSTLLTHDASPGVGHFEEPVVGDIATEWEETPDGLVYTFQLSPDAAWSDRPPANGRNVTAEDVKLTYERYAAGGITGPRFEPISDIEVVSDQELKVTLGQPVPEMLDTFAFEFHPITNPEYLDSVGGDELGAGGVDYIGSGPFQLVEWEPRVRATWERNPNYFGRDAAGNQLPYLDGISWVWLEDTAANFAAFESGDIDNVQIADLGLFEDFRDRDDVNILKAATSAGQLIVAMNHRMEVFQDPRIRRAVSMSIDRALLDDEIYRGASDPALPLPPKAIGESDFPSYDALPDNYQYNPDEARKLVEAVSGGTVNIGPLFYWFLNQSWENQALLIQDMLRQVGIESEARKIDRSEFLSMLFDGTWEGVLMQHSTNPGVASAAWVEWIHSAAPNNFWGVNDPEIDSLVEQLRVELDNEARLELFRQVQDRDIDQMHRPFINQLSSISAWRSKVINPPGSSFLTYKYQAHAHTWLNS